MESIRAKDFFIFENCPAFTYDNKIVVFNYDSFIETTKTDFDKNKNKIKRMIKVDVGDKEPDSHNPILTFILTRNCNMCCRYCSVHAGDFKGNMKFDTIKAVIDSSINKKTQQVNIIFFGGEPTLCLDLIKQTISYVDQLKLNAKYSLSTNGIVSNKNIDFLKEHGFSINLSFDGIPEVQDFLRPLPFNKSSFKIVENTIIKFVKNNMIFKVRATVVQDSVHKMLDFMKYLNKLGVKTVHFEPLNICGRAETTELQMPLIDDYVLSYKKCLNYAAENNMNLVNGLYDNLFSPCKDYCAAATGQKLVVTPENLITRCYEVQGSEDKTMKDFIVGKTEKDKVVFNAAKQKNMNGILNMVRNHCADCFAKYICSSGCTIRTYRHIVNKNFDLSYRCDLAKELIADAIFRSWNEDEN